VYLLLDTGATAEGHTGTVARRQRRTRVLAQVLKEMFLHKAGVALLVNYPWLV